MRPGLVSPAFVRNRDPILAILKDLWSEKTPIRRVLELACGPGQHACYFAESMPHLTWQPCDQYDKFCLSVDTWASVLGVENVQKAFVLDVERSAWPSETYDGTLAINFWHMVGASCVRAAIEGSARVLSSGGQMVVYDCFSFGGQHVSASNERFDRYLRESTPGGRVHEFDEVCEIASRAGFGAPEVHKLPANNQLVVWALL